MTNSELISSVRGMNKQVNSDTRITDRFIYNEAVSIKNTLLKQEETKNRLFNLPSVFKMLNKAELIEVDSVEACDIDSECTTKRTKDKLPVIVETSGGYLIRNISSLDGHDTVNITNELSVVRKISINDKHAKDDKYAYIRNGYMYFFNVEWDYVRIEAVFEDQEEIDRLNNCDEKTECKSAYDKLFPLPNYLEKPLKDLLNESILRYYHRLKEDTTVNKNPNT